MAEVEMDIREVMKHLPHRYPFLLVDRVLELEAGKYLKALKNVSMNEPFFQGHFPHIPVMPGVLVLEALAQATSILTFKTTETLPDEKSLYYFAGIDKARFHKPIEPGDQLILEIKLLQRVKEVWKYSGTATVNGEKVASAQLLGARKELD